MRAGPFESFLYSGCRCRVNVVDHHGAVGDTLLRVRELNKDHGGDLVGRVEKARELTEFPGNICLVLGYHE
jgi:hypothetical protein